jgi:hypothetical protein
MDSRLFCAYNETSKCFLSTHVAILDASIEPLKTLKILMEGPGPDCSSGLWLIHFKGVPVARAFSPFDLIYLDKDFRVVHGVELTADSRFEPFKGQPVSALILPAKTINASKTRTGNRINLREVLIPSTDATQISQSDALRGTATQDPSHLPELVAPKPGADSQVSVPTLAQSALPSAPNTPERTTHPEPSIPPAIHLPTGQQSRPVVERPPIASVPTRVVSASAQGLHPPSEVGPSARTANLAPSGSLLKTAHIPAEPFTIAEPSPPGDPRAIAEQAPLAPEAHAPAQHGTIIPFPSPSLRVPTRPAEPAKQEPMKHNAPLTAAPLAIPEETSLPPPDELDLPTHTRPAEQEGRAQVSQQGAAVVPPAQAKKKIPWDVRLLYVVFPEFDPYQETEFRLPRADFLNEVGTKAAKPSAKLRFLAWLYPELHLENVEKTRREDRAAPRVPNPGLVGYFFTGGHSRPHSIKDISVSGFYMHTEERWLPNTIIRVTLQVVGSKGDRPTDTVTVHSRVVRWGKDGGGFEFVLPGFVDE